MKAATTNKATRFLAELGANVDAWYAGQIEYDAFGSRQRETWDAIRGGPGRHGAGPSRPAQSPAAGPHQPRREGVMDTAICPQTQTRREACACGTCARGKAPDAKRRANKRDALALLDLIAGCIENHPREQVDRATWGRVGDAAHLRERLLEIAVGFAIGPDGDEQAARRRIEEALSTEDEHVGEALIDTM